MFSMVTTMSSKLDISILDMLDMELNLLRFAWWDILRLPGLLGLRRTFPFPDNWVNTPGVDSDLGRDMLTSISPVYCRNRTGFTSSCPVSSSIDQMRKCLDLASCHQMINVATDKKLSSHRLLCIPLHQFVSLFTFYSFAAADRDGCFTWDVHRRGFTQHQLNLDRHISIWNN